MKRRIRLFVDGKILIKAPSGIGRYLEFMVNELSDQGVDVEIGLPAKLHDGYSFNAGIKLSIFNVGLLPLFLKWHFLILPTIHKQRNFDVFWGPAHRLPQALPSAIPSILTIHDLVWRKQKKTMRLVNYWAEALFMRASVEKASRVVCVSDSTRSDLIEYIPGSAHKSITILNAASNPGFCSEKPSNFFEAKKFILFVGTREPRKNLERLCEAFLKLPEKIHQNFKLVIAGRQGWNNVIIPDCHNIVIVDSPSSSNINWLYKSCEFVVFPSLYEGFGLPILEAHASGKAVVTSNISAMPEVGGKGCLYVNPYDTDSIRQALLNLFSDRGLLRSLEFEARRNVLGFSWYQSAKEFRQLLTDLTKVV